MRGKRSVKLFIAAVSIVLVVLVAVQLYTRHMINKQFGRAEHPDIATSWLYYEDYEAEFPREAVSFISGGNRLQGYIYGADNAKGLVVVAHGIGVGHERYIDEIIWFADQGWRVFAYDATGSVESEGRGTRGLPQSALDLDHALSYIAEDSELSQLPVFLFGHSWGGYAVTAVLNFDHTVTASASLSAYSEPMEMMQSYAAGMEGIPQDLVYPFMWLDTFIRFGRHVNLSAYEGVNKSDIPILIVHGTRDGLIPFDGPSLIAKKDQITNPQVQYLSLSNPGQDNHDTIFYDASALAYIEEVNERYLALHTRYNGLVPEQEREAFYETIDKRLVNRVNEALMREIQSFFEDSLVTAVTAASPGSK